MLLIKTLLTICNCMYQIWAYLFLFASSFLLLIIIINLSVIHSLTYLTLPHNFSLGNDRFPDLQFVLGGEE